MKRLYKLFAIGVAIAFPLVSCQHNETSESALSAPKKKALKVNFTALDNDTKAAFGEFDEDMKRYHTFWTAADDKVCLSLNMNEPVEGDVIKPETVSRTATFSGTFENTGAPYKFYALSPTSAVKGISESRASWHVFIPTTQTPKEDGLSCDEGAMILYAESDTLKSIPSDPISMRFHHVPTYCRLALKNLDAAFAGFGISNPVISSVDVSYSVPVAGDWYINVSDGSLQPKDASHTISIRADISDLSQPTDIWYALAPGVFDGATVKVSVNTDKGSLSREYTYGTRTYVAGAVNKLSLDMTKNPAFDEHKITTTEYVYTLVKSLNDLAVGDDIIIADAVNPSYAMTAVSDGTKGMLAAGRDVINGFFYDSASGLIRLAEGSSVCVLNVSSKDANGVSYMYDNKYLVVGTNQAQTVFVPYFSESTKKFTTTIDATGKAQIYSQASKNNHFHSLYYGDGHFLMNNDKNKYTCAIFKKTTNTITISVDPENDPVLEESTYGAYFADDAKLHVPGRTQLSREYDGNIVTFSILTPSENSVVEFRGIPANVMKGDSFTLTVNEIAGRSTKSTESYMVKVIKEEGPKLWLTDFSGNGFIIKR